MILLNTLKKNNLEESIFIQLELLAFDHFKPKQEKSTWTERYSKKKIIF